MQKVHFKQTFQAKDIQRMLDIPKYRYEYIASKIGISPDIREAEGRGRTHLYSRRKVLEFSFANSANSLGLSPKASINMLNWLNKIETKHNLGIYNSENIVISIHYVTFPNMKCFILTGNIPEDVKGIYGSTGLTGSEEKHLIKKGHLLFPSEKDGTISKNKLRGNLMFASAVTEKSVDEVLSQAEGYITINIGKIKQKILAHLR